MNTSRESEDRILQACVKVAHGIEVDIDSEIANAALLLDALLRDNYQRECYNLKECAKEYFYNYPSEQKNLKEVLQEPWLIEISRFKNMFEIHLKFHNKYLDKQ